MKLYLLSTSNLYYIHLCEILSLIKMDKINLNKINFIMSQHMGECFIDTIQNILYFADNFREKFANIALHFFDKYNKNILNFDEEMFVELKEQLEIPEDNLSDNHNNFLIDFFEKSLRRYIFIKLQENISNKEIYEIFDVGQIKSEPLQRLNDLNMLRTKRRRSLDNTLGILIAQEANINLGFKLDKKNKPKKVYEAGFTDDEQNIIFNILNKSIKFFEDISIKYYTYNRRGCIYDYFEDLDIKNILVALYIVNCPEYAHALTIIRFEGEYYLVDNNIGKAVKCYENSVDKEKFFKNIKSLFRITYYSDCIRGYFLGDYKIHLTGDIGYPVKIENIYTSNCVRFFLLNENKKT